MRRVRQTVVLISLVAVFVTLTATPANACDRKCRDARLAAQQYEQWYDLMHGYRTPPTATSPVGDLVYWEHKWDYATAFGYMMCESKGNRYARNPSGAQGLMQILPGGSYDPVQNMRQAQGKYGAAKKRGNPWGPWSQCASGARYWRQFWTGKDPHAPR